MRRLPERLSQAEDGETPEWAALSTDVLHYVALLAAHLGPWFYWNLQEELREHLVQAARIATVLQAAMLQNGQLPVLRTDIKPW